jgi:hypothetical protein
VPVGGREGPGPSAVRDRRDLQDLLSDMQGDGAARVNCLPFLGHEKWEAPLWEWSYMTSS